MRTLVLTLIGVTLVVFWLPPATIAQKESLTLHFDFTQEADHVKDVSGNGNNATIEGNPKWVIDEFLHNSQAMKFSTPNDGLKVRNTTRTLNPQNDKFSIALWFKYTNVFPTNVALLYTQWASYRHEIKDGQLQFGICNHGGKPADRGCATGIYQWTEHEKDTWYHIACVYDGDELREYINGEKVGSVDDEDLVADKVPARFDDFVTIGYPDVEVCLGDVRYYNDQALSEAEITKILEEGLAVRPSGKLPVSWGEIKNNF